MLVGAEGFGGAEIFVDINSCCFCCDGCETQLNHQPLTLMLLSQFLFSQLALKRSGDLVGRVNSKLIINLYTKKHLEPDLLSPIRL